MKLIKYDTYANDPWTDFEKFFNRSLPAFEAIFGSGELNRNRTIPLNLYETECSRFAEFEIPGTAKEDLNIELENAVLTVTASKKITNGEDTSESKIVRSVTVGDDINADAIKATLKDGLLTVELPKQEAVKPRQITVS